MRAPDSAAGTRRAPGRNQEIRSVQPINRTAANSAFGRGKQRGKGVGRQRTDLPEGHFAAAQETVEGILFNRKKMVFARILMPVVVGGGLFDRCRQAPVGVQCRGNAGRMRTGTGREKPSGSAGALCPSIFREGICVRKSHFLPKPAAARRYSVDRRGPVHLSSCSYITRVAMETSSRRNGRAGFSPEECVKAA